jgi:hypothetical protein
MPELDSTITGEFTVARNAEELMQIKADDHPLVILRCPLQAVVLQFLFRVAAFCWPRVSRST